MVRQIVSPLGALFTLEFPDDIELLLNKEEEQARLDRIAYMQRIAGIADTSENHDGHRGITGQQAG